MAELKLPMLSIAFLTAAAPFLLYSMFLGVATIPYVQRQQVNYPTRQ